MENQIFAKVPLNEREQYLSDNAYRVDVDEYLKRLSPEERSEKQENLSKLQAKIIDLDNEKKQVLKGYTEDLKNPKGQNTELVRTLKQNAETITGNVYLIADEENRMMGVYAPDGSLIRSRPMSSEELQKSIFSDSNQLRKAE